MARDVDFLLRSVHKVLPKRSLEYYLEGANSSSCSEQEEIYRGRFAEFRDDLIEQFGPHHMNRAQQDFLFNYVKLNNGLSHYEIFEGYRALSQFLTELYQIEEKEKI